MPPPSADTHLHVSTSLEGQVAVITGGGGGIGRAIALRFAAAGARVVIADLDEPALQSAKAAIVEGGGSAEAVQADVRDAKAVEQVFAVAAEAYGRVDIVVLSAGVRGRDSSLEHVPAEVWHETLETNVNGTFFGIQAAVPHLRAAGGGKIIVLGSASGRRAAPGMIAYAAAAGAVTVIVRVASRELRRHGIAVNELEPGPTATAMAGVSASDPDTLAERHVILEEGLEDDQSIAGEWFKSTSNVADLAMYLAGLPDKGPSGQIFSLHSDS